MSRLVFKIPEIIKVGQQLESLIGKLKHSLHYSI
jgi:hypothetical protein